MSPPSIVQSVRMALSNLSVKPAGGSTSEILKKTANFDEGFIIKKYNFQLFITVTKHIDCIQKQMIVVVSAVW